MDTWASDFNKKAELTTNFKEFIDRNLSVCGINIKDGRHIAYECGGLGISVYHIKGYDNAIAGNNPYMDEIEVPGMGSQIEMISQNLYDFIEGYLWSMRDSYALNFKLENKNKEHKGPTKLTHLLQLYYEKRCVPLNKNQVNKLAADKGFTETTFANRWVSLKKDHYKHTGNVHSAREFLGSYLTLMEVFRNTNSTAFKDVENDYNQLKENYPDLTY